MLVAQFFFLSLQAEILTSFFGFSVCKRMVMRRIFIIGLCVFAMLCIGTVPALRAQILSGQATVSLLTCSPGTELWSKYGHSAIRICDAEQNIDWVFNYGVFNFNSEHFYARFVKGETDYQLGLESMDWFLAGNASIGRCTFGQVLNLTLQQKQAVLDALLVNYRPENRFYRYNFVFDNCATRPYRLLSSVLGDSLHAHVFEARKDTYRNLVTYYSGACTWAAFGINLVFGKDADRLMTPEERLFLPEQLMDFVSEASLADGERFCLIDGGRTFDVSDGVWWLSPQMCMGLLVLVVLGVTYFDMRRKRISWWLDAALFFFYGVLGVICCYLTFFSWHPLVGHNWNILFLSPLMFVPFVLILFPFGRRWLLRGDLVVCLYFYVALLLRLCCGQHLHCFLWIPVAHFVHIRCCWYKEVFVIGKSCRKVSGKRKADKCLLCFLFLLLVCPVWSLQAASPRLTVVVCIDGLNQQCLDELRDYWQPGGLRTLDEEGHESEMVFPHLVYGGSETLATLCTGTLPCTHGIAADTWFSRSDRAVHASLEDKGVAGIGTSLSISPRSLLAPTFTDEFRMRFSSSRSKIYAVGIRPATTVLLAGHAANACTWIDAEQQRWVSTGWYPEGLPAAADKMNIDGGFARIVAKEWTPRMDINTYMHPTEDELRHKGFRYRSAEVLTQSPAANELVVELALALQEEEQLGMDTQPDMLLLELTVSSPAAQSDLLRTAEQEDLYLNVNQHLGYLMEQLGKRVGRDNYRLVVLGLPCWGRGVEVMQGAGMTIGWFNVERAAALLNTYLMAVYGHERWVDGGYMNSIYLNRTLIEQKKMSLVDVQRQVSGFLLEFEGVQSACPLTEVPFLQDGDGLYLLRNSWNKGGFGDVVFMLQPLWLLGESASKAQSRIVEHNPSVPFFLWTTRTVPLPAAKMSATEAKRYIVP